MASPFLKSLKNKCKPAYKVPVEIRISDGTSTTIYKYVSAWSKSKAAKQAMGLCLKDIKLAPGDVTRIKGLR